MRARSHMGVGLVAFCFAGGLGTGLARAELGSSEAARPYGQGAGEELPPELENVDVTEHLGADLPLDTRFVDDRGNERTLRELLSPVTPLILTFNYSNCPLLCSVQLTALSKALGAIERNAGDSFSVATVILDPSESRERARQTKLGYLGQIARAKKLAGFPEPERGDDGWTFLTGTKRDIDAVADAVGFHYTYHPGRKEYLHPAVFIMITPAGKVGQYVYGVGFQPAELDAAITSAALGIMSEATQRFILACYHYEAPKGANGFRVMQIVGSLFAAGVVLVVVGLHLRSRFARRPVGTA